MKPHSVWLSVVVWSCRAKLADHCTLNQTAQAAPDIVKQLVLAALHISSIFISPSLCPSLVFAGFVYEFHYQFFNAKLKSIRTHIVGDKCHTPHTPLHPWNQ